MSLFESRPDAFAAVIFDPDFREKEAFRARFAAANIPCYESSKAIGRIGGQEKHLCVGVLHKKSAMPDTSRPHIALVNPSDMGNLGTILRTMTAFELCDLALIRPCADIFDPRVVRASMGALYAVRFAYFDSFSDYLNAYPNRTLYPFMTDGALPLGAVSPPEDPRFTLIFGNESSGLDASFAKMGQTVMIEQSQKVDSLNLSIAVGIATHHFSQV